MSCSIERDATAVAPLRTFSWWTLCRHAVIWVRSCRQRRRERQELLLFLASDHRAASDIGITHYEALNLAKRPFWRA